MEGPGNRTDADLLALAREGDRSAFASLLDRHKDGMVSYLTRLTGSHDRAEDLAQEAFLRLYAHRGGDPEEGRTAGYLYRIATNLLVSQERRKRRWRLLSPLFFAANGRHGEPQQQSRMLREELTGRVREAVARLPVRYRVPLVLHELEGWAYRDIAGLLGCNEGTVKSRIFRGRQALREELAPYVNGGSA